MSVHNTATNWGSLAKLLHWSMAVLIIGLSVVGIFMANFTDWYYPDMLDATTARVELTQQHKSFGFVVFTLACLRILWRWISPAVPGLPDDTPGWQRVAVKATHYGMYLLVFVMPLSGWLMASASVLNDADAYPAQIKNMVFGLFELPDPIAPGDRELAVFFHAVHEYSGYALGVLLIVHISGVLYHHFILQDSVLTRMLPFGRDRSSS